MKKRALIIVGICMVPYAVLWFFLFRTEDPTTSFGALSMIASLAIVMFGLPFQIRDNKREGKCKVSPTLIFAIFSAYSSWSIYGLLTSNWFIVTSNLPGFLLAGVLLFQVFYYPTSPK